MVKKLRLKFIIYTIVAIFIFLTAILSTINIVNFVLVTNSADETTQMIASEDGKFAPRDNELGKPPFEPSSPDLKNSLRFFTYRFDKDDNAVCIEYKIDSYRQEECEEWAKSLPHKVSTGWTKTYYRYRVYTKNNMRYVVVVDQVRELKPTYNVLWASLIAGFASLVAVSAIVYFLSARLVRPIVESENKKQRFIADAALALRTPISIISIDNASLSKQDGEKPENKSIKKQVNKMFALANQLNSLSSKDIKDPKFSEFNLSNVLREIASHFNNAFNSNKKELALNIDDEVIYNGDSQMLRKAFSEIFDNTLKFADSKCQVSLKKNAERIEIIFQNDCKGIPSGSLDRVFDKFYRLDYKDHSIYDGAGLGLSIAKEIVESHKGRIIAKGENDNFILKIEL